MPFIHSISELFFFRKKQLFHSFVRICQKTHKNELIPVKKNTVPLVEPFSKAHLPSKLFYGPKRIQTHPACFLPSKKYGPRFSKSGLSALNVRQTFKIDSECFCRYCIFWEDFTPKHPIACQIRQNL